MPARKLLYHRGVDDHVGTYITDYVFSGVCFVLCVQLLVRINCNRKIPKQETNTKCNCSNILPWNWPKENPASVTMTTYAVFLLGFSNAMMALLGGLTHQFLQTVEPYHGDVNEVLGWLIIWRAGASFSALLCLSLLILAEQLLVEDKICLPPRKFRIIYYVIGLIATLCLFCYNYVPLMNNYSDPFSIRLTFIISFVVMFLYGVVSIIVFVCNICCRKSPTDDVDSPVHSIKSGNTDAKSNNENSSGKHFVSCCGDRIGRTSRKWELFLRMIAPWMFLSAGVMNYFLKNKCSDSHSAHSELGCPLPDSFNHNALMHAIQIFSIVLFFVSENMAITRRKSCKVHEMKRATTSSTIYNDANSSCLHTHPELPVIKPSLVANKRCDSISKTASNEINHSLADVSMMARTKFTNSSHAGLNVPMNPDSDSNRLSLYDNLSDV